MNQPNEQNFKAKFLFIPFLPFTFVQRFLAIKPPQTLAEIAMTLIDWDKVNELRNEVGPEDFGEVVELFLEEVEQVISELGSIERSAEHDLHFLKGSALNLGFSHFSALCSSGETAAQKGTPDAIDFSEVQESYKQSKHAFLEGLTTRLAS